MTASEKDIPRGRVRRVMPLAGFTARAAGGRLVAGLQERTGSDDAVQRFHERTAERYTELLGHSKGALMKVGQAFSMVDFAALGNGGMVPYQKALSRLQADAPPMDSELAREVLQAEIGLPLNEVFAEFSEEPLAAASIGQVHRAVLHDGRQVVVKVQYPGVGAAIRADLANAELLATFFRFLTAASGMQADIRVVAREATARITEELDYRHEAAMITRFSDLYRGHPCIRIPEVIPELCGDRVLTMTFLDGANWATAQSADQDVKNMWAETIQRFSFSSYRQSNLFHVDPHPGNYCFYPDGTVGFLDFGCVRILPELQRRGWIEMSMAAFDGRLDDLRDVMAHMGFLDADPTLSAAELYDWVRELLYEVFLEDQPVTYGPDTIDRVVHSLFDTRDPHSVLARMSVPAELSLSSRVTLGINALCGALNATLPARAIAEDLNDTAPAVTTLGKAHQAWVRERGLPNALDLR